MRISDWIQTCALPIFAHAVGALDVQAAGVEAHALADEHDVLVRVIAPVQADQPWRTVRGATDGVDRGEVLFQQLVADDALELRAVPVRHFARAVLPDRTRVV